MQHKAEPQRDFQTTEVLSFRESCADLFFPFTVPTYFESRSADRFVLKGEGRGAALYSINCIRGIKFALEMLLIAPAESTELHKVFKSVLNFLSAL